ncbi:ABC transporter ATP-binding protein [Fibrobacterota bacterium]
MKRFSQRWALVFPYLKRYRSYILSGLFCVILSTAMDQVSPWMIKIMVDNLTSGQPFTALYMPLAIILATTISSALLLYMQRLWVIQSSRKIEFEIRQDLFATLQKQPKTFFDKNALGDLMSNATNDLDRVRDFVGVVILHLARMICMSVFVISCIWMLHPVLAILGIVPSLVLPLFVNRLLKKMHSLYGNIQKNLGLLNSFVQDTISGIQVVKAYGKEEIFQNKFESSSNELRKNSLRVALFTSGMWPLIGILGALGILLVVWYGARMVIAQQITIGTLTAALIYLLKLQFPMAGLGWVANLMQRSNAAMDRLLDLQGRLGKKGFTSVHEHASPPLKPQDISKGHDSDLDLRGLSFRYGNGPQVLDGIDLKIPFGSSLGIVGPTGSGKSTLLHIICGIYLPPPRQLYLAAKPREDYSEKEWMSWFALAPQDGFLFSRSIRDNILLGQSEQTLSTVEEAGKLSGFSRDLPQIQMGYEALLGERGINLSGGQRQRVGLARAIFSHSSVLCLDDTLSSLDTETESQVLANLRKIALDRTLIIISHRYSSVRFCDTIIFLDKGRIAEAGTHHELMNARGLYAQVYDKQMISMDLERA